MIHLHSLTFCLFILASQLGLQPVAFSNDVFRDQVVPVFQARCVGCHNSAESKGDFSLEDAESFFGSGQIEKGDSESSNLVDLIKSSGGQKAEMPKTGKALTELEINSIKQWIDEGAKWPDGFKIEPPPPADFDWWSLQPIKRPSVPAFSATKSKQWVRTPVDAFVLSKLKENGLGPSREADKRTLIRRLSYDLTGLPPTFDEIRDFENDSDPRAYENLVDRLLASPRYGERWARHWLDVVKYADTCGYDKDKLRPHAWPYRDYVIRSFNQDKPYSRFVQEQIAGDVLYPDSPDGILGLGFIAAGPWDFIGHVEVPESKIDGKVARNLDRDDMVSNTMNTFCSVTIQCARCHDHKFDPFTQEHYYGLQAVFAAVDRADRVYQTDPKTEARRNRFQAEIAEFEKRLGNVAKKIAKAGGKKLLALDKQIESAGKSAARKKKRPEFGYHSQIAAKAIVEKWVEVELGDTTQIESIILRPCHDDFNQIGAGFGFPVRFRVEVDGQVVFDKTNSDYPNPQLNPVTIQVAKPGTRVRVVATKLAVRKDDFHFAFAEIEVLDENKTNIAAGAKVTALDSIEAPVRWRKSNLTDGIWFESGIDVLESLRKERDEVIEQSVDRSVLEQRRELKEMIAASKKKLTELPKGKQVYAAATKFPVQGNFKPTNGLPRPIHLLVRGDVTSVGITTPPGVLPLRASDAVEMELEPDADESQRRARLAMWVANDQNPLTWRSIVNRVWHHHFGRGIVDTPNDLGRMGGERSHPELLDWLAAEFQQNGGSLKKLHRLLVTSSVYRQSSAYSLDGFEKDSGNRLLWKMNRRRLSAEEIRDSVLMASGSLNLKMGGPGYYLFALEKTEHSPHYEYHKFDHNDPNSYRRSIYRFIVRSQPDPFMTTLDCADSSQSTPARNETQTPLQSLSMLNSDFSLVMARQLAERLNEDAETVETQIQLAMNYCVGRDPTRNEQEQMTNFVNQHGLENLARIIFNLSEFIYVD